MLESDAWSVGSWLPITQTVSADHNTTINILHDNPKEKLPWFPHKLKPQYGMDDSKARSKADAGSSPQCSKTFFSLSQLFVQTLLQCLSVQPQWAIACINICVHVKTPKHSQPYNIVWTCQNTAHADRNG